MRRTLNKVQIAEEKNRTRFMVIVEDDPSVEGTHEADLRRQYFLEMLVDQPALLMCGPAPFEKLTIYHNGISWIASAVAVADDLIVSL